MEIRLQRAKNSCLLLSFNYYERLERKKSLSRKEIKRGKKDSVDSLTKNTLVLEEVLLLWFSHERTEVGIVDFFFF